MRNKSKYSKLKKECETLRKELFRIHNYSYVNLKHSMNLHRIMDKHNSSAMGTPVEWDMANPPYKHLIIRPTA